MSDEESARMSAAIDQALTGSYVMGLSGAVLSVQACREFAVRLLANAEEFGYRQAATHHRAMIQAYDIAIRAIREEMVRSVT